MFVVCFRFCVTVSIVGNGTAEFHETSVLCQFKDNDSCDHLYYIGFDPTQRVFDNADSSEKYFGYLVIHHLSISFRSE